MKKITLLLLFIFIASATKQSQAQNIDSLINVISTQKPDTNKINTLSLLADGYWKVSKYEESIKHANEVLELSKKLKFKQGLAKAYHTLAVVNDMLGNTTEAIDYSFKSLKVKEELNDLKGMGISYNSLGVTYKNLGEFENAKKYHNMALKIRKESGDERGLSFSYHNLGIINHIQGNYAEALNLYLESLKIREKLDDKYAISNTYMNLGLLYEDQSKYDESLKYHEMALKLSQEVGAKAGIAGSYSNIGNLYSKQGKYKEALTFFFNSLEIFEELKRKHNIANTFSNIALAYSRQEDFENSLKYNLKALKIREELGDSYSILISTMNMGEDFIEQYNTKEAKKYLKKALEIALAENLKKEISTCYNDLYLIDSIDGNFKGALEYFKKFKFYEDSLFNEDNTKKILESQMQYEYDKKEALAMIEQEKKDALMYKDKQRQQVIIFSTIAGLVLVLVFLIFVYNRLQHSKKQNKVIENQKKEVESQKNIVESKNHEITQSIQYAQKIQSALLPNEEIFRRFLPDSFIIFKPKDIVSGDFYWLSDREDYVFYATADSTGHGVPGGFMSMLGTALLNEIIDERKIKDCGEVLTLMREKIMQALKQTGDSESKDGMDMVLIRIDKKTLEMEYAAANNSFYLVSNKQLAVGNENCKLKTENCQLLEMPCDKMPVGVYHSEVKPFQTFKYQLQKGDIIYTYTDGYADQFGGEKGKKYTYKRLREKLVAISEKPLAEQKMSLENEFESWQGDNEQIDDVCLIGVKV
jgi:tetratricopeptide (TPR) repeat protein